MAVATVSQKEIEITLVLSEQEARVLAALIGMGTKSGRNENSKICSDLYGLLRDALDTVELYEYDKELLIYNEVKA